MVRFSLLFITCLILKDSHWFLFKILWSLVWHVHRLPINRCCDQNSPPMKFWQCQKIWCTIIDVMHLNCVTIYASAYGKRNWKYNLQLFENSPENRSSWINIRFNCFHWFNVTNKHRTIRLYMIWRKLTCGTPQTNQLINKLSQQTLTDVAQQPTVGLVLKVLDFSIGFWIIAGNKRCENYNSAFLHIVSIFKN